MQPTNLQIRPLTAADLPRVKEFADRVIGTNYYSLKELKEILSRSQLDGEVFSLILVDTLGRVQGVRITYPPGQWLTGKGQGLRPDLWPVERKHCAYFQSLFIAPELAGQGLGTRLSRQVIDRLQAHGAKAIIAHSWKESPHDSSGRYLRALGFRLVTSHPEYWKQVDYECPRCGRPCLCTAEEMILVFDSNSNKTEAP